LVTKLNQVIIQLEGTILPVDFDRNGHVLEITLETGDFIQYTISGDHKGKELLDHTYAHIMASAVITGKDIFGNSVIRIIDYKLVDSRRKNRRNDGS